MLILVDIQNDYFHPDGKFYIEESKKVVAPILKRIEEAKENKELIICTRNTYTEEDTRTKEEKEWAESIYEPFIEATKGLLVLDKLYYGPSIESFDDIKGLLEIEPETIEFAGVETDLCIMANAIIFQSHFYKSKIIINKECTATSREEILPYTYTIMENLNMDVK